MEPYDLVNRVRAEFDEMPGLRLTREQAARLLGLDQPACDQVIDQLVATSFLRWSAGAVVRRAA